MGDQNAVHDLINRWLISLHPQQGNLTEAAEISFRHLHRAVDQRFGERITWIGGPHQGAQAVKALIWKKLVHNISSRVDGRRRDCW